MHKKTEEQPTITVPSTIFRIIKFIQPFFGLLFLTILLNGIFSIFSVLTITTIKPVFQIIFKESPNIPGTTSFLKGLLDNFYRFIQYIVEVPNKPESTLINLGIFIIVLFIFKNFFKYLVSIVSVRLEEGIIKLIRDKVFKNLTSLSVDFFSHNKSGSLISIITNDVTVVNNSFITSLMDVIRETILITSFLLVLMAVSLKLTLIASSTSIISFIIIKLAVKYIRRYATRMQVAMAEFTTTLQESIFGIRVIKAYNAEDSINNRFSNHTSRYVHSSVKHRKVISLIPALNEIFAILALCIVLFVGGIQVLQGTMKSADLMLFLFNLFSIMAPLTIMINSISNFQRGFVAAGRVFSILDRKPSVKTGKEVINSFNNSIEIKDLSFSYNTEPVLQKINFSIPKGKKIAFVGSSGCGKSTMLDLIIRFYDPNSGSILIDNKNIKDLDIASYRTLFGTVSQESMLFNDTVANNIKFGNSDISDADVIEAAKIANAYNFIKNLTYGFDTIIGDRGVLLSGGEKQRISIARALVRNPQILIFDEATSSLDAESEKVVQEAINYSLKDRTAIIVAHRLSTIIDCDEIYVFDQGKIVEYGTHSQLISMDGFYKKLYEIQFSQ